jgi:hypothetical protein
VIAGDASASERAPGRPQPRWRAPVLAAVRHTVRALLEASPGWQAAAPGLRRDVARSLVAVGMMAADLAAIDHPAPGRSGPPAIAQALDAPPAPQFAAARNAGRTIADLRKALDFPEYVTSLITGVFQAITKSNLAQITALSDLLDNVAKTSDEFTAENIRDDAIVQWAVGKLPFLTTTDGSDLVLRPGADLVEKRADIRNALEVSDAQLPALDEASLMDVLGPLIKRKIGKERQQILGTLVQMGLQRIVVDEGRLHASMDMRVDTRSVAESDRLDSNQFSMETGAAGSFGVGAWGASAHVNVGFNKVSSEHDVTKDEIATRAGLRSSVDLAFRTEQVPLDKMVGPAARVKLDNNSRVPASVADGNTSLLSPATATAPAAAPPTTLTPGRADTPPPPRPSGNQTQAGQTQAGQTQAGQTQAGQTQAGQTQAANRPAGNNSPASTSSPRSP